MKKLLKAILLLSGPVLWERAGRSFDNIRCTAANWNIVLLAPLPLSMEWSSLAVKLKIKGNKFNLQIIVAFVIKWSFQGLDYYKS